MSLAIIMLSGPPMTEVVKTTASSNCLETSVHERLIRSVCVLRSSYFNPYTSDP